MKELKARGLTPSFQVICNIQVIFHVICLFGRNEGEIVCEGVSFSKVTNLQCSDCNFAIKIAHHRYFLEYVPETSCLKEKYFKKKIYGVPGS